MQATARLLLDSRSSLRSALREEKPSIRALRRVIRDLRAAALIDPQGADRLADALDRRSSLEGFEYQTLFGAEPPAAERTPDDFVRAAVARSAFYIFLRAAGDARQDDACADAYFALLAAASVIRLCEHDFDARWGAERAAHAAKAAAQSVEQELPPVKVRSIRQAVVRFLKPLTEGIPRDIVKGTANAVAAYRRLRDTGGALAILLSLAAAYFETAKRIAETDGYDGPGFLSAFRPLNFFSAYLASAGPGAAVPGLACVYLFIGACVAASIFVLDLPVSKFRWRAPAIFRSLGRFAFVTVFYLPYLVFMLVARPMGRPSWLSFCERESRKLIGALVLAVFVFAAGAPAAYSIVSRPRIEDAKLSMKSCEEGYEEWGGRRDRGAEALALRNPNTGVSPKVAVGPALRVCVRAAMIAKSATDAAGNK